MSLTTLLDLLRQRIGLNPDALSTTLVPTAAEGRMRALGLRDLDAYAARVQVSLEEFQTLVEELVVPETWFFRGGDELFVQLAAHADAIARSAGRPVRILSVPCSTGEEPFSVALALLRRGIAVGAWVIDGIDLSLRNLKVARTGSYRFFRAFTPPLSCNER